VTQRNADFLKFGKPAAGDFHEAKTLPGPSAHGKNDLRKFRDTRNIFQSSIKRHAVCE
jgi:hypothetical protein